MLKFSKSKLFIFVPVQDNLSNYLKVWLGVIEGQLQAERTQRQMEMEWRKAEEKCANKILQDQITEIQVGWNDQSVFMNQY